MRRQAVSYQLSAFSSQPSRLRAAPGLPRRRTRHSAPHSFASSRLCVKAVGRSIQNPKSKIQNPAARRAAFSLAEMMVAIGVLGIGMTMVACFFPVAMYQHADNTVQQNAMRIASDAKNLVMQIRPDPGDWTQTANPYLGLSAPPGGQNPLLYWNLFNPRAGWLNVVIPPAQPFLGTPPLYQGASNPAFNNVVRYIWYPFAKRVTPTDSAVIRYLVAVTRRLPGQAFPGWGYQPGSPTQPFPSPLYFNPADVDGTPGGLYTWGDRHDLVMAVNQTLVNEPLANGWRLVDVLPPGSKVIAYNSLATYTVISAGSFYPNSSVRLREALLPGDATVVSPPPAPPANPPGEGGPFIFFPPPIAGAGLGDKTPLVMTLYF